MLNRKRLGLMKKSETKWFAKDEKISAVNINSVYAAIGYIAASLAI